MFLFVATNMAIFCKCSKLFREDDVGVLTLSSRAGKGRNGGENVREDDVGVLTLSSRAGERIVERVGAGQCLDMPFY